MAALSSLASCDHSFQQLNTDHAAKPHAPVHFNHGNRCSVLQLQICILRNINHSDFRQSVFELVKNFDCSVAQFAIRLGIDCHGMEHNFRIAWQSARASVSPPSGNQNTDADQKVK